MADLTGRIVSNPSVAKEMGRTRWGTAKRNAWNYYIERPKRIDRLPSAAELEDANP